MDHANIDRYTVRHLDVWLNQQINGDAYREKIRQRMLDFISEDPEHWGSQSWWLVFDRSECDRIERED